MGTIAKALSLLDHFSPTRPEIGLTEFQKLAGQDKATTHRHLTALAELGFLEQNPDSRAYRLGPALMRLADMREATFPQRSLIRPLLDRLSDGIGELVHASHLSGSRLTSIYITDIRPHGLRVKLDPSEVLELHATSSGLACLAHLPDQAQAEALAVPLKALTPHTVTDPADIAANLPRIRARGYAQSDQTMESGVASFAVPMFDPAGRVQGAMAVAYPVSRATPEHRAAILRALLTAAPEATRIMGGRVPPETRAAWAEARPDQEETAA